MPASTGIDGGGWEGVQTHRPRDFVRTVLSLKGRQGRKHRGQGRSDCGGLSQGSTNFVHKEPDSRDFRVTLSSS